MTHNFQSGFVVVPSIIIFSVLILGFIFTGLYLFSSLNFTGASARFSLEAENIARSALGDMTRRILDQNDPNFGGLSVASDCSDFNTASTFTDYNLSFPSARIRYKSCCNSPATNPCPEIKTRFEIAPTNLFLGNARRFYSTLSIDPLTRELRVSPLEKKKF